jgi:TatD DNase family protein
VVDKISEIRGESFSEIAEKTTQNARELFALP